MVLIDPKRFEFRFGKYKGMTYDEVKKEDPQYLMWCHNEIEWFELPCDEVDEIEELTSDTRDPERIWHDHYGD
jgi:broad specificity phosphatase PhoE